MGKYHGFAPLYEEICHELGYKPVTLRRINDIISDLEMLGIISAPVVSLGRYGRTKLIHMEVPVKSIMKVFEKEERFSDVLAENNKIRPYLFGRVVFCYDLKNIRE